MITVLENESQFNKAVLRCMECMRVLDQQEGDKMGTEAVTQVQIYYLELLAGRHENRHPTHHMTIDISKKPAKIE